MTTTQLLITWLPIATFVMGFFIDQILREHAWRKKAKEILE